MLLHFPKPFAIITPTQGSYIGNTTASQAVKAGSTPVPCSKKETPFVGRQKVFLFVISIGHARICGFALARNIGQGSRVHIADWLHMWYAITNRLSGTTVPTEVSSMAEYEMVREIQNLCPNNQMRDIFFDEVETEDPESYVRTFLKGKATDVTIENGQGGAVTVFATCDGMVQKFVFTPI